MDSKQLLCKDCAHSRASWYARLTNFSYGFKCNLDWAPPKTDRVTGQETPGYFHSCGATRTDDKICGPTAKSWTPRTKSGILTLLKVQR